MTGWTLRAPHFVFLALALCGAHPEGVRAQPCVLDKCLRGGAAAPRPEASPGSLSESRPDPRQRSSVAPGDFEYYVLALSWSPGFCALSPGGRDAEQCGGGAKLGFVVHGLWPQRDGALVADCPAGQRPPARSDVAGAAPDLFPTEGLARYEWRKHGGCTGLPASAYFANVRRARDSIVIPPMLAQAQDSTRLAPEDILRAFRDANPRLRPGMAAVSCPKGVLQEVRICMSKDLRDFTPCPDVVARSCRARQIEAPPPL